MSTTTTVQLSIDASQLRYDDRHAWTGARVKDSNVTSPVNIIREVTNVELAYLQFIDTLQTELAEVSAWIDTWQQNGDPDNQLNSLYEQQARLIAVLTLTEGRIRNELFDDANRRITFL